MTLIGVLWIAIMTCDLHGRDRALARRPSGTCSAPRSSTLALFAIVALVRVYAGDFPDSIDPSLSWLNPFEIDSTTALIDGVLVAVFIYWGWDSAVSVNEETEDPSEGPGRSAVISTLILLGIYVIVAVAAQAVHGPEFLQHHKDDVLSGLGTDVFAIAARQAADHRRAHLGGGLDADDDPADRAHVAVDGARCGRSRRRSRPSTAASRPRTSRRS